MLARARVSIGAVPSGAALSVEFGEGQVHRGVGFQRALLREARVVLFLACSGGSGAVGVVQGGSGQAEEVVQLDEGFLGEQVPGVVGVLAEPTVDVALVSTSAAPLGSAVIFGNRAMVLQMICASMRRCRVRARRSGWVAVQPSSARSSVSVEGAEVSARGGCSWLSSMSRIVRSLGRRWP